MLCTDAKDAVSEVAGDVSITAVEGVGETVWFEAKGKEGTIDGLEKKTGDGY